MRILIIISFIVLASCNPFKSAHKRWHEKGVEKGWLTTKIDSVEIHDTVSVPVIIRVPPSEIEIRMAADSLCETLKRGDTIQAISEDSLLEIKADNDSIGKIHFKAHYKGKTIKDTVFKPVYYKVPCPPCEQAQYPDPSLWERVRDNWWIYMAGFGSCLFVIWLIRNLLPAKS